jgi:hypothetical protein
MERELSRLDPSGRTAVERLFAERGTDARSLALRYTAAGTPRDVLAPGLRIRTEDLGLTRRTSAEDLADAVVLRFAPLWRVSATDFQAAQKSTERHHRAAGKDVVTVEYRQMHRRVPVVESVLRVHVDEAESAALGITGSFSNVGELSTKPTVAANGERERTAVDAEERAGSPRLVVWSNYRTGPTAASRLSWEVPVESGDGGVIARACVDATTGRELARVPIPGASAERSFVRGSGRVVSNRAGGRFRGRNASSRASARLLARPVNARLFSEQVDLADRIS